MKQKINLTPPFVNFFTEGFILRTPENEPDYIELHNNREIVTLTYRRYIASVSKGFYLDAENYEITQLDGNIKNVSINNLDIKFSPNKKRKNNYKVKEKIKPMFKVKKTRTQPSKKQIKEHIQNQIIKCLVFTD